MIIGFNTSKPEVIDWIKRSEYAREVGCNAIEISFMKLERLDYTKHNISKLSLSEFEYKSLHAPVVDFYYKDDELTHSILNQILEWHITYSFDTVVIHPNKVLDWGVLDNYDLPFAFENMDNRVPDWHTPLEFEDIILNKGHRLVIDINHLFTVSKDIQMADVFYEKYKDNLAEVHLSGFETFHDCLYKTKQSEFIEWLRDKDIPIIIESSIKEPDDIKNEFEYITTILRK